MRVALFLFDQNEGDAILWGEEIFSAFAMNNHTLNTTIVKSSCRSALPIKVVI